MQPVDIILFLGCFVYCTCWECAQGFTGVVFASPGEGLHAGPPFFEFLKYSAVFLSRELMIECVSKDGLVMPLTLSFQYLPDRDAIKNITELYR